MFNYVDLIALPRVIIVRLADVLRTFCQRDHYLQIGYSAPSKN